MNSLYTHGLEARLAPSATLKKDIAVNLDRYSKAALRRSIFAACLAGGLMLYFILMMPPISDNFIFSLGAEQPYPEIMAGKPIRIASQLAFSDIWTRSAEMFTTWDGRFTGNVLMSFFLYIPYAVYAVLAALMFVVYLFVLHMCIFGSHWRENLSASWILALAALLWAALPSFGSAFFWVCVGGANALLCQAAFLLPYRVALDDPAFFREEIPAPDRQGHPGVAQSRVSRLWSKSTAAQAVFCLLFGLFGLFTAMLDYSTAAVCPVMAVGALLYIYFRQEKGKRVWPRFLLCGALGVGIGGMLTIAAPGNAKRMLIEATYSEPTAIYINSSLGEKILSFISRQPDIFLMLAVPYALLAWGGWALWRRYGKVAYRHLPAATYFFGLAALLAQGAYLFAPAPPPRAYATIAVQLILAGCALAAAVRPLNGAAEIRSFRVLQAFLVLYCLVSLPQEIIKFSLMHTEQQAREAAFADNVGKRVCVRPFSVKGDRHMVLGSHLQDISYDPDFWVNRVVAAHYRLRSVRLCPFERRHYSGALPGGLAFQGTVGIRGLAAERASKVRGPDGKALRWQISNDGVAMRVCLTAKPGEARPSSVALYYYGRPALLSLLFPQPQAYWVSERLKADALGRWLIPLFYARTEASLHWMEESDGTATGRGTADLHGFYEQKSPYFVVRPGDALYPFDLVSLKEIM